MGKSRTAFQSTFTEAEKQAVVRASVVDGLSSREVAAKAARGELEGAGRFKITDSYVRRLTARHRADHSPERLARAGEATRAREDARTRMLSVILGQVDAWEKRARAGEVDLPEHDRLMRALAAHERGPGKRQTGQDEPPSPEAEETADAIVRALQQRSHGAASNGATAGQSAASLSRASLSRD